MVLGDTSFEEDDMFAGASVQNIQDLGEISRAFENSSDPNLRKQAALFDELLLTIAAPKNWLQEKKAAESERINSLKKKYNETRVEFDKKNATEATEKSIKDSGMTKEYRTNEHALSTRYCPDHPTVAIRLLEDRNYSENVAWTGKEYSFVNGYTLENGDKVPGGAVENQGNFDHIDHFTMYQTREERLTK